MFRKTTINKVKRGDYFRFRADENAPIWVRDYYEREEKKYCVYKFYDANHFNFRKGNVTVYVD